MSDSFGLRLRTLRQRLGWNQPRMAKDLRTSERSLSRWESDTFMPRAEKHRATIAKRLAALAGEDENVWRPLVGLAQLERRIRPDGPRMSAAECEVHVHHAVRLLADQLNVTAQQARSALHGFLGELHAIQVMPRQAQEILGKQMG